MRKSLIGGSFITAAIFVFGVAAGQIIGIGSSAAASNPAASSRPAAGSRLAGPPPFALGPRADGTVTAISGDTVTIKADGNHGPSPSNEYQNVTTLTLNSATTYLSGPGQTASASSIKVGSYVIATGTLSSDGVTLTANKVVIGGDGLRGGPPDLHQGPAAIGSVTAVNGDVITVKPATGFDSASNPDRTVTTITLTASTAYVGRPGQTASSSSIRVGDHIVATGTLSSDGTGLTATRVMLGDFGHGPDGPGFPGGHPAFGPPGGFR